MSMSEKENYFKSYFKAYGVFATLLMVVAFAILGYVAYVNNKIVNENIRTILYGAEMVLLGGFAVLGISKLKSEKISFIDFLRCVGLLSSIALIIMAVIGKRSYLPIVIYAVLAAVFLAEIVVRFLKADDPEPASFKNYFGALAGAYNPLFILLVGIVLAVVATILAAGNFNLPVLSHLAQYKYAVLGAVVGGLAVLVLSGIDREVDVTLLDLGLAVLFVSSSYFLFLGATVGLGSAAFKADVLIAAASAVSLVVRGFTYNKGKYYGESNHKIRYYFLQVYDKFNVVIALTIGFIVLACLAVPVVTQISGNSIAYIMSKKPSIMAGAIIVLVVCVALLALSLVFRKFTSSKIEKIDYLLIVMLYSATFVIPFIIVLATQNKFNILTDNIIMLVAMIFVAIVFVFAAVVQFIRLRSYDALSEVVKEYETKKEEAEEQAAEEEAEKAAEEEEKAAEEEEKAEEDPFAISEDEEELLKQYYGDEEQPEEEAEEAVEEEVVEEEVVEEEVVEEEPVEEEPVEEVVEEQPIEEEVVEEEPAEEEEAEEEEDADDEADDVEDDGTEVEEIAPKTKEAGIIVQDFQVLDEDGNVKKIKRRFNSRMMFAPYETKEYYNEIKNYLVMYRAKGRISSRCESYRYKGLVAKVALGGKSIKVFLALDTSFIDANPKYHLKDLSSKKQYEEVPVMIKVRSPRALKYFKELVDIMMANRGVKPKRNFQPTNYMPELIPNGEAIMATLGMRADYLQNPINVHSIPEDMPDDLEDYLPMIQGQGLEDEEVEATVYVDTLCNHFEDGDEITIDLLKSLHIVTAGNVLRIKARGTLDRKLTIYAEYFDADALKMLMCANCRCIKIIHDQEVVEE